MKHLADVGIVDDTLRLEGMAELGAAVEVSARSSNILLDVLPTGMRRKGGIWKMELQRTFSYHSTNIINVAVVVSGSLTRERGMAMLGKT